jgi:hypothetical protein
MRFIPTIVLCIASLSLLACGCADSPEPEGPEMGSVQAYLDAHPEEREDTGDDAGSEEEEFDAAGAE